jgi:hypothetical protein
MINHQDRSVNSMIYLFNVFKYKHNVVKIVNGLVSIHVIVFVKKMEKIVIGIL